LFGVPTADVPVTADVEDEHDEFHRPDAVRILIYVIYSARQ